MVVILVKDQDTTIGVASCIPIQENNQDNQSIIEERWRDLESIIYEQFN